VQKGLAHFVAWERERFAVGPGDRCAQLAAPAVDVILRESFLALTSGATLCLPDREAAAGPAELLAWCERERITMLHTVPTLARAWLAAAEPGVSLAAVRWLLLVGEPLPGDLVRAWRRRFPGSGVVNLYGSTESNLAKSFLVVPDPPLPGNQPAGPALPETQVLVLGEAGGLCAVGERGEIALRTPFLSLGYLGETGETARRFVPNPCAGAPPGERILLTGDAGRYRPDGAVEVLGRRDEQVKIRGVRVEPEEVAAVLASHPAVAACAVLARPDAAGGHRLSAYVIARDGGPSPAAAVLLAHVARRLPAVMVPAAVIFLGRMPLTATGKLDRRALLRLEAGGGVPEPEAPRTPAEELVAGIWAAVLGRENVGIHDNFFALGGHSLLATQVVSRLREAFGVEVPLRRLFEAPTVAALAAEVAAGSPGDDAGRPTARRRGPAEERPLSFAQERIWLLDQLAPAGAYNLPVALRLRGRLDPGALAAAFSEVLRRHEVLRAVFPAVDGLPVQRLLPPAPVQPPVVDLSALPQSEAEVRRLALDEARRPFDLGGGPLYRLALLHLDPADHVVLLTIHHIASDGWSRGVLTREWSALYRAVAEARPSPLPELPLQYADVAEWERQRLRGEALESRLGFWRATLAGAPAAVGLPADHPREPATPPRGAHHRSRLPRDLARAAAAFGRERGASPFMVLLAAFELLLWRWSGQEDQVVGTVVAHRPYPETERLIGCFVNFLPLRVRLPAAGTGLDLLHAVRAAVLDAWAHQDCPFEKLVEAIRPDRRAGSNPLYNVGFLLQSFPAGDFAAGLSAEPLVVDNGVSLLDLRLVAMEDTGSGEIDLWWEYDRGRFEPATIEWLAAAYAGVLAALVERPEAPLADAALPVSPAARRRPRLVVASTFTADPVLKPVRFWLERLGMDLGVEMTPYHQVFQQLLATDSSLASNLAGANALLVRLEDWTGFRDSAGGEPEELRARTERAAEDLASALEVAAGRSAVPWLVLLCPPSPAFAEAVGGEAFLAPLEARLAAAAVSLPGAHVAGGRELARLYPVPEPHDPHADRLGHVPYTPTFFTALATLLVRKLHALRRPPYKVVAVDCDGTLWDGVCGEDGPLGVRLDAGRLAVQEMLVRQHDAGLLICLCSKNAEADVAAVFDLRPEMPLRRAHLAAWRVGWGAKSESLRSLAAELGVGLESFIFLDDNPVECAEVQAGCPGVTTLRLPPDPAAIPNFLRHVWAFDALPATPEDRSRTEMYRHHREREQLRRGAASLEEFLAGLRLEVGIRPVAAGHLPRVAQLIQRTNQLNLSLVRRDEAAVQRFLASGGEGLEVEVSDRFGDYGLVGVALFRQAREALAVDTLLLSCRVLGRGVEQRLLARLGEIACERGLARVDLPWTPGERNQPALDFLLAVAGAWREPGGQVFRMPAAAAGAVGGGIPVEDA
jgi:FkbH-like protein